MSALFMSQFHGFTLPCLVSPFCPCMIRHSLQEREIISGGSLPQKERERRRERQNPFKKVAAAFAVAAGTSGCARQFKFKAEKRRERRERAPFIYDVHTGFHIKT